METSNLMDRGMQALKGNRQTEIDKFSKLDSMDKFTIVLALQEKQKRLETQLKNDSDYAGSNLTRKSLNYVNSVLETLK